MPSGGHLRHAPRPARAHPAARRSAPTCHWRRLCRPPQTTAAAAAAAQAGAAAAAVAPPAAGAPGPYLPRRHTAPMAPQASHLRLLYVYLSGTKATRHETRVGVAATSWEALPELSGPTVVEQEMRCALTRLPRRNLWISRAEGQEMRDPGAHESTRCAPAMRICKPGGGAVMRRSPKLWTRPQCRGGGAPARLAGADAYLATRLLTRSCKDTPRMRRSVETQLTPNLLQVRL